MGLSVAGIYVTDNYVDVAVTESTALAGGDAAPFHFKEIRFRQFPVREFIGGKKKQGVEVLFREIVSWIDRTGAELACIGVGSFGPFASLDHTIPIEEQIKKGYGTIQKSVHTLLEGYNLCDLITNGYWELHKAPPKIVVQTDVSVAALGELYQRYVQDGHWVDSGRDRVVAFLKISVGIGGSVVFGERLWAGQHHTEMGHIRVARWESNDPKVFRRELSENGTCQFHGDCLEGLASVASFQRRWSRDFYDLERQPDHPAFDRQAFYVAQFCIAVTYLFSPAKIVLGGRIMNVPGLLEKVRRQFINLHGVDAPPHYEQLDDVESYIAIYSPRIDGCGSGILGALGFAAMSV
ncbi:ROK family protein [Pseudahrensia aquimaris]|uniref:fructokinase n=1 Tax=Pseudahrensia aquimaris TaxID=744461 RepID=A0ABW3FKJ6_9HYPH